MFEEEKKGEEKREQNECSISSPSSPIPLPLPFLLLVLFSLSQQSYRIPLLLIHPLTLVLRPHLSCRSSISLPSFLFLPPPPLLPLLPHIFFAVSCARECESRAWQRWIHLPTALFSSLRTSPRRDPEREESNSRRARRESPSFLAKAC